MVDTHTALEAHDNYVWICDRWPDLRARLHPALGSALTGMPGHSAERPLPMDTHVADLMFEITSEAAMLAHVLMDETDYFTPPPSVQRLANHRGRDRHGNVAMPDTLRAVAAQYGHWTACDERTALAFCDWGEDMRERVRRTLERPAPPQYIGPCQREMSDGGICQGELYLRGARSSVVCPVCRVETTVEDQRDYILQCLEERLMTQSEIVSALTILNMETPKQRVSDWAGTIAMPAVVDLGGVGNLYRLSDAMALAARRARKKSRAA